ncbi:hypothetical protein K435DRAFT_808719 [Dendrothele bispora CBS 962.96]|uniref:Uncharacterized protein n=1 Tax=Dendrothele bispora (strain CBS 962.96) TaxID=1314807 RepID=A0A4S8L1N4_DENBC|nr:hypothetical protein K435DRAFT_808719 [Dendrothele bispora CBS 962.96]
MLSPAIILFRLRYPCLTLFKLRKFVDRLDVMARERIEDGETTNLRDVDRLRRQINDIEYEWSKVIFLWSSVHGYLRSSLVIVWDIAKCYDKAQVVHVYILDAIADKRRALEDFEDSYRRNRNVKGNHRQDTNVDTNTDMSIAIGHTTARP